MWNPSNPNFFITDNLKWRILIFLYIINLCIISKLSQRYVDTYVHLLLESTLLQVMVFRLLHRVISKLNVTNICSYTLRCKLSKIWTNIQKSSFKGNGLLKYCLQIGAFVGLSSLTKLYLKHPRTWKYQLSQGTWIGWYFIKNYIVAIEMESFQQVQLPRNILSTKINAITKFFSVARICSNNTWDSNDKKRSIQINLPKCNIWLDS